MVVTMRPGEFAVAREGHDAVATPRSTDGDHVWWDAIRMPAGTSSTTAEPESVAMMPFVVRRPSELLGRELAGEVADVSGRAAVAAAAGHDSLRRAGHG